MLANLHKVVHGLLQKLGQTALGAVVGVAVDGVDHIGIGDLSVPIVGLLAGSDHFNQALNAEFEGIHLVLIHDTLGSEERILATKFPFGEIVDGALHHLGIAGLLIGDSLIKCQIFNDFILNLFFALVLNERDYPEYYF